MKQFPISSLSEIFCLKLKVNVWVAVNLLIISFCKSAKQILINSWYKKKILKIKNNVFIKMSL